jgi:hypothetical protein
MNWKFWDNKKTVNDGGGVGNKLSKPKELPQMVGRHLVVSLVQDPDWVWGLKAAMRPKDGSKSVREIRVFNPVSAANQRVAIRDFTSLDDHPELVLFDGWFDSRTNQLEIQAR